MPEFTPTSELPCILPAPRAPPGLREVAGLSGVPVKGWVKHPHCWGHSPGGAGVRGRSSCTPPCAGKSGEPEVDVRTFLPVCWALTLGEGHRYHQRSLRDSSPGVPEGRDPKPKQTRAQVLRSEDKEAS